MTPPPKPRVGARLARWALVLSVLGAALRLVGLGRQGLWSDEQFTLLQTSSTWGRVFQMGSAEVHPPTFAILAHLWVGAVGGSTSEARLLPALIGILTVLLAWRGLRDCGFDATTRNVLTAMVACSGMALVHTQDFRSYGLLLLFSTGATAAALRLAQERSFRRSHVLALWCLAASATHLFGMLLGLCLAVALRAGRLPGRSVRPAVLAALVPQALWCVPGVLFTDGFAEGAKFPAPDLHALTDLLMAVLGGGHPTQVAGGFRFPQPWLLVPVLVLAVLALAAHRRPGARTGAIDAFALHRRVLGVTVLLLVFGTWTVSQAVHLWTLRNLIVVLPATVWWFGLWIRSTTLDATVRDRLTAALLGALTLSLTMTGLGLWRPYKTDFTRAIQWYVSIKQERPELLLVGNVNPSWALGTDIQSDPDAFHQLTAPSRIVDRDTFPLDAIPRQLPTVYLYYLTIGQSSAEKDQIVVDQARGDGQCTVEPLEQIVAVFCDPVAH